MTALKAWNAHHKTINPAHVWAVPRKGTPEHAQVVAFMEVPTQSAPASAEVPAADKFFIGEATGRRGVGAWGGHSVYNIWKQVSPNEFQNIGTLKEDTMASDYYRHTADMNIIEYLRDLKARGREGNTSPWGIDVLSKRAYMVNKKGEKENGVVRMKIPSKETLTAVPAALNSMLIV